MRADERALADLAASVADGESVDWAQVESRAGGPDRRLIQHLRLVENISSLFRTLPHETPSISELAESVADGSAVDWPRIEAQAEPADQRLIRHLRLVESISTLHRSLQVEDTTPDSPAVAPAGVRWGRLELRERIGQGTSCEVYRAWDTELHREVAVKLYHAAENQSPTAHDRMLQEARRLARVQHPHVVHVYGAERHDGRVGLWMELVRGESLEQLVQARRMSAREAALVGLDICAALAAVHGAGLLHRDVKAQNVMRASGGRIVLMDFGTGEDLRPDGGTARLVGTPLYVAPEVFEGKAASVQSDLYALGVLLFYLVTGEFPVVAGSMEHLARAHAHRQSRRLRDLRPDLPEAYVSLVERALDPKPARRFPSAGEMEAALRESLDALPAPRVRGTDGRAGLRLSWSFVAMAAALCILVAGLIVWTRRPLGGTTSSVRSLAVLPLVDRSAVPVPLMADAITAQLTSTISQIDALRTTAVTSSLTFKDSDMTPAAIAEALGVDAVLQGTINVTGGSSDGPGNLHLELQLMAAGGGGPLWTGVFDRPRGNSEALNADIVRQLAAAVNARISGAETTRLQQARSRNPDADEAYLQGRLHLAHYGAEPARRALDAFRRALTLEPGFGAAHAGAALAYIRLGDAGVLSIAEARLSALADIRKAFDAGDDSAEVHAALAETKFLYDWDWKGAERDYRRALDRNAGFVYARSVYAQLFAAGRRFDEALRVSQETMRLDPQSTQAVGIHALLLYYKRDFVAARKLADEVIVEEPGNVGGYVLASRVAEAQGRYSDALDLISKALDLSVGTPAPNLRVMGIRALALAGHRAQSEAAASELVDAAADGSIRLRHRDRAYMELGLGRTEMALRAFESALEERDPSLVWITVDPRVDSLRDLPRFQEIVRTLGFD